LNRFLRKGLLSLLATFRNITGIACILTCIGVTNAAVLGPEVQIIAPGYKNPDIFWAHADPMDRRYMLVCMQRQELTGDIDASLYRSSDSGGTWQKTIVDRSTTAVAEESCDYGRDGRAYFTTGTWIVRMAGGKATDTPDWFHLFRSNDHGLTWSKPIHRGFVDWTLVTADRASGERSNRVYVFGHLEFTHPLMRESSPVPILLASQDGGRTFTEPVSPAPHGFQYVQGYPGGAAVLDDGTVVAGYALARMPTRYHGPVDFSTLAKVRDVHNTIELMASHDAGKTLRSIAIVHDAYTNLTGFPSLAVDTSGHRFHGRLYLAWTEWNDNAAKMYIASSDDRGKTWQNHVMLTGSPWDSTGSSYRNLSKAAGAHLGDPSLAVNIDGTLGMLWSENGGTSICFAVSRDGGKTFVDRTTLSTSGSSTRTASLKKYNTPNVSLAADAAGLFHAFWTQPGPGGLWTRSVTITR